MVRAAARPAVRVAAAQAVSARLAVPGAARAAANVRLAVRTPARPAARARQAAAVPILAVLAVPAAVARPAAAHVRRLALNRSPRLARIVPARAGRPTSTPSAAQAGAIRRAITIGAGASACCCRACS